MKIILSDFDGTLFFGKDKDYSETAAAIKKWQNGGNLFAMVTGRSMPHLSEDLGYIGITPDYYVLSTGATLYNKEKELIDIIGVEGKDIETICNIATKLDYVFAGASATEGIFFTQKDKPALSYDKNFIAGFTRFASEEAADIFEEEITKALGHKLLIMRQGVYFDMPNIACGKAKGIERLLKILNIEESNAFCVGDGVNDLDMLKRFQSYSLHSACTQAKEAADKLTENIVSLIDAEF